MLEESWSLAHFASYKTIAAAAAIAALPLLHPHSFQKNAQNLSILLAFTLAAFLFIAVAYFIILSIFPLISLPFNNLNLPIFIAVTALAVFILLHAVNHISESIPLSLCCISIVIASPIIYTHNHFLNLYSIQSLSHPLNILSFILASSLALDILSHSHSHSSQLSRSPLTIKKNFLITPLNLAASFIIVIATNTLSNGFAYNALLILATALFSGLIPSLSFWKNLSQFSTRTVAVTIAFFQSSLALKIFFSINFQSFFLFNNLSFSLGLVASLLILAPSCFLFTLKYQEKILPLIISISLSISAFTLSLFPHTLTQFQTLFILSFPFFTLVFQQKNPASSPPHPLVARIALLLALLPPFLIFFYNLQNIPSLFLSLFHSLSPQNFHFLQALSHPLLIPSTLSIILLFSSLRASNLLSSQKNIQRPHNPQQLYSFFFNDNSIIISFISFIYLFLFFLSIIS